LAKVEEEKWPLWNRKNAAVSVQRVGISNLGMTTPDEGKTPVQMSERRRKSAGPQQKVSNDFFLDLYAPEEKGKGIRETS